MTERFLRLADVAAMLGTSPGVAASILAKRGVFPVDFGMGRGRGQRWLESAVVFAMREMALNVAARHAPRPSKPKTPDTAGMPKVADMSPKQLKEILTPAGCVQ